MSEHAVVETETPEYHIETAPADGPDFQPAEIRQFDDEDTVAGSAIGKLLCFFFLYTVIAMSFVGWWTWSSTVGR